MTTPTSITLTVHQVSATRIEVSATRIEVSATRIEVTGPGGSVTTIDVPTGYEMRIVQRPWWRRAWSKVRTWAWRARWAWGSR